MKHLSEATTMDDIEHSGSAREIPSAQPTPGPAQEPCGGRSHCARFPFCGCGGPGPLPERDQSKPAEQQGLFRKFDVRRVDGSSEPGGKHEGCEYFVLDVDHDPHARAALAAYAASVAATHPALASDMRDRYDLPAAPAATQPTVKESLTVDDIWRSDEIMSVNARLGLQMPDLLALVRAIESTAAKKGST